jgi:YgiT-type zinc finger domain-containing protein
MQRVVSEHCPLCGGRKQPGKATYRADVGSGVLLVRHVPVTVCAQCGEAWIDHHMAQKLEQIPQEAREKSLQVAVVAF